MAFLLLITSSGVSMDVHFCQGKFKRANIFGKAKTCQEVKECLIKCGKPITSCHADNTCSNDQDHKGCCNNESFDLDLDLDAFKVISAEFNEIQKQFLTAFTSTYVLNLALTKEISKFTTYQPPPLEKDIAVLFQVFRL
jgi:hypothetical protein